MAVTIGKQVTQTAGPFLGVQTRIEAADHQHATWAENVLFNMTPGGAAMSRPAFTQPTSTALLGGLQSSFFCHTVASTGAVYNVAFSGGKMFLLDTTTLVTSSDITPGTVSITSGVAIYCCSFGDVMIVSDGVNRPWKYNFGTATASYLTGVTGAVVGPPVVYYAKLFCIKASERNTIIWSEENDPDTGYEAGGYNNAWTLSQTDQEPLQCLYATNEALYYFRQSAIGAITGAVNSDFVNAGTHDSISESLGTIAAGTVVGCGEGLIFFLDQFNRPRILSRSGEIDDRLLFAEADASVQAQGGTEQAVFHPELGLVLTSAPTSVAAVTSPLATATGCRVYHIPSRQFYGVWSWTVTANAGAQATLLPRSFGLMTKLSSPCLVVAGTTASNGGGWYVSESGAGADGFDRAGASDTSPTSATRDFTVALHTGPLGPMGGPHIQWLDLMALVKTRATASDVTLAYRGPADAAYSTAQTVSLSSTGTGVRPAHAGINKLARYLYAKIGRLAAASPTEWQLHAVSARGVVADDSPGSN